MPVKLKVFQRLELTVLKLKGSKTKFNKRDHAMLEKFMGQLVDETLLAELKNNPYVRARLTGCKKGARR